jgi:hypothetical protein
MTRQALPTCAKRAWCSASVSSTLPFDVEIAVLVRVHVIQTASFVIHLEKIL